MALEHELDRSLRVAQAPVIAAAEAAAGTVTNFEAGLAEMVDAVTETAVERAVFFTLSSCNTQATPSSPSTR